MLNDPSNQMIGSSSNPANNPGSSSNPNTQTPYFPTFSQQNPYMNPDEFALFSQWKMRQQQQYSTFSQQQQQNQNESQPRSSQQSFHLVDKTEDDEEEEPCETALMSGENDKDFMERCHMLFKRTWKNDFKHPGMFQEMLQQQYALERKMKQDVLERESRARVDLLESQKIAEDMRVLTMDTSSLDPMNAAIVKAQQARIRAKYPTQE
ncbi:hypothetical protein Tco_0645385 [Tanacetum coccineum]